jgi:fibronectin type 3 domain-containing protein
MDWIQSSSSDAVGYIVYRQPANGERIIISRIKHNPSTTSFHFADTTVNANLSYAYTAEAIDEDSLHSPLSIPVLVKINAQSERPAITGLKAAYDDKLKVVRLSWQYNAEGDCFFIIYRAAGDEPLQRWQSVPAETKLLNDINAVKGKTYRYAIQAIYKDSRGNTRLSGSVGISM